MPTGRIRKVASWIARRGKERRINSFKVIKVGNEIIDMDSHGRRKPDAKQLTPQTSFETQISPIYGQVHKIKPKVPKRKKSRK
ncbi:MAG: hypothetical protein Q7K42_00470 [Candidatus Diapherotrites archaeon]|nr:hypothetical protein [Candidatus Diapherotrites archaeon]